MGILGFINDLGFSGLRAESSKQVLVDELIGESVDVAHLLLGNPSEKLFSLFFTDLEDGHQVQGVLLVTSKLLGFLLILLDLLLLLLLSFLLSLLDLLLDLLLLLLELLLKLLLLFLLLLLKLLLFLLLLLLEFLLLLLLGLLTGLEEIVEDFFGLLLEDNRVILSWDKRLLAFFIDHSEESMRSLVRVIQLQERIRVWDGGFTDGAKVEVFQN